MLQLTLTRGQLVIAKCVFGDTQPKDLPDDERAYAEEMLGGLLAIPSKARRVVYLRLGRGSGKTTIAAAWNIYVSVTADLSRCGPGDIPVAVTVAPDKNTAKLSIRMAREMMRGSSALNSLVIESSEERIDLRRPDGRRVAIEAFAASRGGSSIRGRSILTFLLDEAEFFRSDDNGSYLINDRDIYGALMPRLLPGGKGIFLSTPWPVETMMAEEFTKNFGKPATGIAVKATSLQMRGDDPEIAAIIEQEMERDPENARREYFCEVDRASGGEFFDPGALSTSLDAVRAYPVPRNPLWPAAAAADFAFRSDSSTLVIVQYDGRRYIISECLELRPKRGQPLKPSEVCREFAHILKKYGLSAIVADGHYREAIREHLSSFGISIIDAPEGLRGKQEVFTRTKAVLHEGLCTIPDNHDGKRLIEQAKTVIARPSAGGALTIKIPRRVGTAHGDLISAWTLAVHRLAYSQATEQKPERPEFGTPEWFAWVQVRDRDLEAEREKRYLKGLDRQVKHEQRLKRKLGIRT